ncbi:hypothetical protein Y032_0029g1999 [Ancylostoma ceylanicum]|nr:hypothetical protein Y032_0029g1999 [Ancylostoma ceylanicum]
MQIASGVITGAAAMPSCAASLGSGVSSPVCCSYDAATPSSFTAPRPAMEKQHRSSAASATEYVRAAAAADHVLEYSVSTAPSLSPSDALQVAHDQLRKVNFLERFCRLFYYFIVNMFPLIILRRGAVDARVEVE